MVIALNRKFTTEEFQMAEKHFKKCSISLVIREIQIKMTLRVPVTTFKMAKF